MTRRVPARTYTHDSLSFLKNLSAIQFHINKNMYDEACVRGQVWKDEHPRDLNHLRGLGLTSSHLFLFYFLHLASSAMFGITLKTGQGS